MDKAREWFKKIYEILPYQEIFSNEEIKIARKIQIVRNEVDIKKEPIIEYKLILFIFDNKTKKEPKSFSFFSVKANDPKTKYVLDLVNLKEFCDFIKNRLKEEDINLLEEELKSNIKFMLKYIEVEEEKINQFLEIFINFYNNYLGRIR